MKYEINKYYRLNPNKYYWCTNIQKTVKFEEPPIIKLEHFFKDEPIFGKLIQHDLYGDIQTDTEIEITGKDIMNEYHFQKYYIPFFYMDFPFSELNKDSTKSSKD